MTNAAKTVATGSHWGTYEVEVADGRIVGTRPSPHDREPSPLHRALPEIVEHPTRIAQPMVREGYLRDGIVSDRTRRGAEPFVPVSWERALDLVAGEIERVKRNHGNASIYAGSYGWASAGRLHHPRTLIRRLLNLHGGSTEHVLDYSRGAALVIVPHVLGSSDPVGTTLTAWESIIESTRLIVAFGGLSPKNMQIDSGGMGRHRGPGWMRAIRDAGIATVYVGPLRNDVAGNLGAEWLPLRPNTDTALMLGIAHTLVAEGLHDRAFLDRYCVGFERFEPYLMGRSDGTPKSAEWAAAICEIDAERIRVLARRMAASRTMITLSYSLQRADHGEQPMWMGITLAAMLGQIGLPGGGFGIGYGAMGTKGVQRAAVALRSMPTGTNPTGSVIPVSRISDMLLSPGESVEFNGKRIVYPDIRMIYWGGGNPFHHHQDLNRLLRAWRKPETVVVQDPFWSPVARLADIVLPAATALERNDVSAGWYDPVIYAIRKAIAPVGESRTDLDIVAALADRLGHGDAFRAGRSDMDWLRYLYDALRKDMAAHGADLPEFDRFWAEGRVELPVASKPYVLMEDFRRDPQAHPLKTPSGRIEIYSETIASFDYDDCPGHPVWLAPCEWLGSPQAQRYPLHMISNQPAARLHSQLDQASVSGSTKVQGREPIWLHPTDAAARSIADGVIVRVYNDRGACLAGARITERIRPGVVQLATGAWYDPAEPGTIGSLDKHGNPNVLTIDKGTSRLAQAPIAQSALVEVERWNGEVLPVTAHVPPPIASVP